MPEMVTTTGSAVALVSAMLLDAAPAAPPTDGAFTAVLAATGMDDEVLTGTAALDMVLAGCPPLPLVLAEAAVLWRAAVVEDLRLALGREHGSEIALIDLAYAWHWDWPYIRAGIQQLHDYRTDDLDTTMDWLARVLLEGDYSIPGHNTVRFLAVALRLTAEYLYRCGPAAWNSFLARCQAVQS